MATTLYLIGSSDGLATTHLGSAFVGAGGGTGTVGWSPYRLSTTRGTTLNTTDTDTTTGPTNGVDVTRDRIASPRETIGFFSPPVAADVTISGTITANIWAAENNMSANVAINVIIRKIDAVTNAITQIVKSTNATELAVTTRAANNFTSGMTSGYSPVTLNRGDRLLISIFGDDAGTMATAFTFQTGFGGATGGADGDSFVTFTETITFENDSSSPAGSTIYLTDTASDVATASVDREAWTSRGSGVVDDVTNTAAGFTSPIQVTDTAGGTVVDWFTKQLQTTTLGGITRANIRALESNVAANASLRLEIARVDSDGTNPTVWGSWCLSPASSSGDYELLSTEAAYEIWVSGDDITITNGQRLRIRLYIDDSRAAMASARTVTSFYSGTSGGASGDSYVIFPVVLFEYTGAAAEDPMPFFGGGYYPMKRDEEKFKWWKPRLWFPEPALL